MIEERVTAVTTAGLRVIRVEAGLFAVHAAVQVNHPEVGVGRGIIAFADESRLVLVMTDEGRIVGARSMPVSGLLTEETAGANDAEAEALAGEAAVTWQAVFGGASSRESTCVLAGRLAAMEAMPSAFAEALGGKVVCGNPGARVSHGEQAETTAGMWVAEGLALRGLEAEGTMGVDFLQASRAQASRANGLRRQAVLFGLLCGALGAVLLGGLFVRLHRMEKRYATAKEDIRRVFRETVPHVTQVVDEAAQLEAELTTLRREHQVFAGKASQDSGPLEILALITAYTPKGLKIEVENLVVSGADMAITASCGSYKAMYAWAEALRGVSAFASVSVEGPRMVGENQTVHFEIAITLAGRK